MAIAYSELLPVIFEEGLIELVGAQDGQKHGKYNWSWLDGFVWVERPVVNNFVGVRHVEKFGDFVQ